MTQMHGAGWKQVWVATAMTVLLPVAGFRIVHAADATSAVAELRQMSTTIVTKVVRKLQELGLPIEVRIGAFTNETEASANTGGIFATELKAAFGSVANDTAATSVVGAYSFEEFKDNDNINKVRVKVKMELRDVASGRHIRAFYPHEATLVNASNTAQIQGRTAVLPKAGAILANDEQAPFIAGTQIKAFPGSPYAIEIMKRPANSKDPLKTVEPELVNSQPFVPLFKGEVMQVRVLNYSSKEIGISMKLDGVDQFALSKVTKPLLDSQNQQLFDSKGKPLMGPRYRVYIVDPSKNGVPGETMLSGWHITDKISEEFEQVALGKGVRSLFPELVNGPVGVITVGICSTHTALKKNKQVYTWKNPPPKPPVTEKNEQWELFSPNLGDQVIWIDGRKPPKPAVTRKREDWQLAQNALTGKYFWSDISRQPRAASSRSLKSMQAEQSEIGRGKKFEHQVQETERITEDPNTIITVRYHR